MLLPSAALMLALGAYNIGINAPAWLYAPLFSAVALCLALHVHYRVPKQRPG